MARLPSRFDLSAPQSGRSGRSIASYDVSAIGRGVASLGASISDIGADISRQRNTVDLARAEAYKTKGFIDTENEFSQDGDYSTFWKRAPAKTGEVVNKAADLIRDPAMREKWKIGAQTDAVRTNDAIGDKARALGQQAETVAFDDALEVNRRLYVDPTTTEAVKAKAKADIEAAISTGQSTGLFTPAEAAARRDQYINNANFSRAKLAVEQDPNVISKPLPAQTSERVGTAMGYFQSRGWTKEQAAGIVGNLLAESTLNTGARNGGDGADGSDSIGIAQWNSDRARRLKEFAALNRADWKDFGIQLAFVDHELQSNEKAAGDQLRGAKDVQSATEAMIMYERPAGSQAGAKNAHNYKGRLKFAANAAGIDVNPDWFNALSPEEKQVVYNQAETRQRQIQVAEQGNIETVVQNAPVAMQNTGTYDGSIPSQQQFMDAYGPQEGSDRFAKFTASMDVGAQSYNFRTMSVQDIEAAVAEAKPTSSGNDAALETARYETLSNAAEATIKARQADPAAYTRQAFPSVNRAWETAAETGNYQQALTDTANAQTQLGIQNMKLMPKDVADGAVARFKDATAPEQERITALTGLIFSTPDTTQQRAVFNQLVEAGLPDTTEGAIDAFSRGDEAAGRRLMEAAIIDPSKLPGVSPVKPAEIDTAIQSQIMDEGQIGDIVYGLTDGTIENQETAIRDAKLLTNAVNIRVRNGEALDVAVQSAAKDLYGDIQAVTGNLNVNAQIVLPTAVDPAPVLDGLTGLLPTVRSRLEESVGGAAKIPAGPVGKAKGVIEQGNIDLEKRPQVRNEDGSVSTVRSMSFNEDGQEILIPTVSPGGTMLTDEGAIALYHQTGQHLGKFDNPNDATAYAEELHKTQEAFYASRSSGGSKIIEATTSNYIENVLSEGYFRNSGNGYVFIDPFVGAAVAGPDGKPLMFTDSDVLGASVAAPPDLGLMNDDAAIQPMQRTQEEIDREAYGEFAPMLNELQGDGN